MAFWSVGETNPSPMNTTKHANMTSARWMVCVIGLLSLLCGCAGTRYEFYHSPCGEVTLVAHPAAFPALQKGDLAEARRILEAKLTAAPQDPELNYTLGCVDLMQSEEAPDKAEERAMQMRGWQRVEIASGKFYAADTLLAHAYLIGRWGKPRNRDLYEKHLRLSREVYRASSGKRRDMEAIKRSWGLLTPS